MRPVFAALLALALAAGIAAAREPSPSRWAFEAGWGLRLAENPGRTAAEREYHDQARMGEVYGLNVSVYPWKFAGLGLELSRFSASASESNMTFLNQAQGPAENEFRIVYVAPAAYVAREFGERVRLLASVGAGWVFYRDEARAGAFPGVMEGVAPGLHATGAVDFFLSRRIAVGAGLRALQGRLERIRYNAIPVSQGAISLTRMDLAVGIRFYP